MTNIPKLKRDSFIFISNLGSITANPDHPISFKRDGYLLSEHYTNKKSMELASLVKKKRNLLVSDNGNFTRMKAIASKFDTQALMDRAKMEHELGALSVETKEIRKNFMTQMAHECEKALEEMDFQEVIGKQVSINPDYLIGLEDFTIPVFMLTGMMHPFFEPNEHEIRVYQERTAQLFSRQLTDGFQHKEALKQTHNFLVLHAYDYMSAFQGGKGLNTVNMDGIAISYGGPMLSRRWITELRFQDELEKLDEKLPEPYLIASAITVGAANGIGPKVPVHVLGVGSPIMVALIGYMLRHSSAISIDSTAPFKDSNAGTLYGSKMAFLKMDMYKVAAYALIDNKPFSSTTPFFKRFEAKFPSDWDGLRTKLGVNENSNVKELARTLKSERQLLEQYIPFFSRMRSGTDEMIQQLRIDRAGHNFWILRNICVSIRRRMHDPKKMEKWMNYQVKRYRAVASKKWSKAVEVSFELARKHGRN